MAVDLVTALDEFSTLLRIMNVHRQHNNATVIELMLPLVVVAESCAFVFAVVVLLMQIHYQVFPVFRIQPKLVYTFQNKEN